MPILLLILGALGLLAIGAGWLQNITGGGADRMHVDLFWWTLGPLSHGAWLLLTSLFGMLTLGCLLGAFALFRRLRRRRGAAEATAGEREPAGRIRDREDVTYAQGRDRDVASRRRDTGRARERVTAEDEQVTTGREYTERDTTRGSTGQARTSTGRARDSAYSTEEHRTGEESRTGAGRGDVRDNIPPADRGEFRDTQHDVRDRASDAASRGTREEQDRGGLLDKVKEMGKDKAKDAFDKSRNRR